MANRKQIERISLARLIQRMDSHTTGELADDTVPTGFPSLDRMLGGGMRRRDLVVLGGDVGSGKSALALAMALRSATIGTPVVFFSGEMDEERVLERAMAIEGRTQIDQIRKAEFSDETRSAVGSVVLNLQNLPLYIHPLVGHRFDEALDSAWKHKPKLIIVDYLQLLAPPSDKLTQEEDNAATIRALKGLALERDVACLLIAQLPLHQAERMDPRPTLDDFGTLGSVKQHADIVLGLFREEMYNPGGGVEGAAELIITKNRNGPTGFIDLYFYHKWMRFEDMLDPDR